ncbi:hypothetical protein FB451DRAFT_1180898 [Mycena latifolia]|nr:hypothetical protein FB451DRAFT_1180898 [Mycena latifolia]
MPVHSKLAAPSVRSRAMASITPGTAASVAAAAKSARRPSNVCQDDDNKENESTYVTHGSAPAKRRVRDEDEYADTVGDQEERDTSPSVDGDDNEDVHMEDRTPQASDAEEDEQPARAGRTHRVSEKEAQRQAEKEEADKRRAAKAANAAKKQRQQTQPEYVVLQDTVFTSRKVDLPPNKAKALYQRDTRVPVMHARPAVINNTPAPARGRTHGPSQDLRHIIANHQATAPRQSTSSHADYLGDTPRGLASSSISDWRRSAVAPMPVDNEECRPQPHLSRSRPAQPTCWPVPPSISISRRRESPESIWASPRGSGEGWVKGVRRK